MFMYKWAVLTLILPIYQTKEILCGGPEVVAGRREGGAIVTFLSIAGRDGAEAGRPMSEREMVSWGRERERGRRDPT